MTCLIDGFGWCEAHMLPFVVNPLDPTGVWVCATALGVTPEMMVNTPLYEAHERLVNQREELTHYEENYHEWGDCDHSDCLMDDDRRPLRDSTDEIERLWVTRIRDLLSPDDPDRLAVEDHLNTLRGTL